MSKILLAEDEELIRTILVDALGDFGLACIEAPTGQAALDILQGDMPLGAIIVDIGLPDMSGERVIEAATRHRPNTPIIRCTGSVETGTTSGSGVYEFPKPYSATELSEFVASLVGGGQ